jgi:hypothetical protein
VTIRRRLERLESSASGRVLKKPPRGIDCQGMPLTEILTRIEKAHPEGWEEYLERIGEEIDRFVKEDGKNGHHSGFMMWLFGLQEGWLRLPRKIPLSVLRAFVEFHPANMPLERCQDCLLGLPANFQQTWEGCPACHSSRVYWADTSKPWGTYRKRTYRLQIASTPGELPEYVLNEPQEPIVEAGKPLGLPEPESGYLGGHR